MSFCPPRSLMLVLACLAPTLSSAQAARAQAEVIQVREIVEQVNQPVERCWVETTTALEQDAPQARTPAGAVMGAVAGGVIGNRFGKGQGNALATGAGIIAGAMLGDTLANGQRYGARPSTPPTEVRRCSREDNWVSAVVGYDVTYRYGNLVQTSRYSQRPGNFVEVELSMRPLSAASRDAGYVRHLP